MQIEAHGAWPTPLIQNATRSCSPEGTRVERDKHAFIMTFCVLRMPVSRDICMSSA